MTACRLSGASREAVYRWAKAGRATSARPEHRKFSVAFDEAKAELAREALKQLRKHALAEDGGNGGVKATLAILAALDPRFGDRRLHTKRLEAEVSLLRAKAKIAEAASNGEVRPQLLLGLEHFLSDDTIPIEVRIYLSRHVAAMGVHSVSARDLASEPAIGEPQGRQQ